MATYDPQTGLAKKPARLTTNSYLPDYGGGGDSSAGTSINVGGFTPDYAGLIANDPGYLALKNSLGAAGVQDKASRTAARQRALIQFGFVPDFGAAQSNLGLVGSDIAGDVTPDVSALAQQNTQAGFSTEARIDKAYQDQVRQIKNVLASRGLLRSGEAGYQLGEAQHGYETAQYDATQKLLDYLAGVQQAYTAGEQQRQATLAGGVQQATTNVLGNPANAPTAGESLPWNGQYGGYGPDASGNIYDVNHNKIGNVNTPAPPQAPPDIQAGGNVPTFTGRGTRFFIA